MEENEKRLKRIRQGFDLRAEGFDPLIKKLAPQYRVMLEALCLSLPFSEERAIKVVDLGCGTGTVAALLKKRYPDSEIICVDFSSRMISAAKKKLAGEKGISFKLCNVCDFIFQGPFDAVVSSLCLHHLYPGSVKEEFFEKVYKSLSEQGVFYIFDVVKGTSGYLQGLYQERWREFLNRSFSAEEVDRTFKKAEAEDRPFTLIQELEWLKEAGFSNLEVICKSYSGAVYGGQKITA